MLSTSEYKYICNLVHSIPNEEPTIQADAITSKTTQILFQLNPFPVLLQNEYLDIIGSNAAFDRMVGFPVMEIEPEKRNYLYLTILNTDWKRFLILDS